MKSNGWKLMVSILLLPVEIVPASASRPLRFPRSPTTPMPAQINSTLFPAAAGFAKFDAVPSDPWSYMGPNGRYRFSNYHNPSVELSWLAKFLMTCIGDVYEATAKQGFRPNDPYPNGVFNCHLTYLFPSGLSRVFALEMKKADAPGWSMTFSDVADDLEAFWYAALWFEERAGGLPEMNFDVYKSGRRGIAGNSASLFLASNGNFEFELHDMTKATVSDA